MARGFRSSSFRFIGAAGALSAAGALASCSALLGIDDGIADGPDAATRVGIGADAASHGIDAGAVIPGEAAADETGEMPSDDGGAGTPEAGCASDPAWCNGRCDQTTDNCGLPIDCGSCEAGVSCFSNVCGCMPDPVSTTCAGRQCGSATNNCNLTVNCGVGGSPDCPSSDVCMADAGTCCSPDNATACSNRCQVQVTNNCGAAVSCSCASGQVCYHGACCVPSGCGGSCLDNCGQSSQACCPTVSDAGSSPPADSGGGSCTAMGAGCTSNAACCSGACETSGICISTCGVASASCNTNLPCCYGLTCRPVLTPESTSVDPNIVPEPSRCE